jgi:hypothetical protein
MEEEEKKNDATADSVNAIVLTVPLLLAGAGALAQNGSKSALAPSTPGQNAIEDSTSPEAGKVTIKLNQGSLWQPTGQFQPGQSTARGLRFPNTVNALGKTAVDTTKRRKEPTDRRERRPHSVGAEP